jgi:putative transposase
VEPFRDDFAAEIRRGRVQASRHFRHRRWHLDEMFVKMSEVKQHLRHAVDHEGEVLENFVTKRRDRAAALKFIRKSLRRHGLVDTIVTDRLASYGAALKVLGVIDMREVGRPLNSRVEKSHQPFRRRERAMLRFRRMRSRQKFASVHGSIHNRFNQERALTSRQTYKKRRAGALAGWRQICVAWSMPGQGSLRDFFGLSDGNPVRPRRRVTARG